MITITPDNRLTEEYVDFANQLYELLKEQNTIHQIHLSIRDKMWEKDSISVGKRCFFEITYQNEEIQKPRTVVLDLQDTFIDYQNHKDISQCMNFISQYTGILLQSDKNYIHEMNVSSNEELEIE